MTNEMLKALDDPNGVPEDVWIHILCTVGDNDPSVAKAQCFGGRYYLMDDQKSRLKHTIPFLMGKQIGGLERHEPVQQKLALPPHVETPWTGPPRCGRCKGPYHEATGHIFSVDPPIVACGPCYGRFAAWQLHKYDALTPMTKKEIKRLNKKKAKAAKKAEKQAKLAAKQKANEEAKHHEVYAKAGGDSRVREAQPAEVLNDAR